jgi:hypothetical protein
MCYQVLEVLFPLYRFRRNVRDLLWLGTGIKGGPLELDVWCDELKLALEFNGFLHDGPVGAYGGDAHFEKIKEHDERKLLACSTEPANLLVVRFTEVSINQRQCDLALIAAKIWEFVAELRYLEGTHLASFDDLLSALGIEE